MLNITEKQKDIMKKYNINYDTDKINELLENIDWAMTDYIDEHDEPNKDFLLIEELYDQIYNQNPPKQPRGAKLRLFLLKYS